MLSCNDVVDCDGHDEHSKGVASCPYYLYNTEDFDLVILSFMNRKAARFTVALPELSYDRG